MASDVGRMRAMLLWWLLTESGSVTEMAMEAETAERGTVVIEESMQVCAKLRVIDEACDRDDLLDAARCLDHGGFTSLSRLIVAASCGGDYPQVMNHSEENQGDRVWEITESLNSVPRGREPWKARTRVGADGVTEYVVLADTGLSEITLATNLNREVAEFMSHAPSRIGWLLSEIKRLREKCGEAAHGD